MRTSLTVFAKEVIDNFRDRRTLASALIMGPLFGPMLFAFVINLSIERSLDDIDRSLQVPVIGQQLAAYPGVEAITTTDALLTRDESEVRSSAEREDVDATFDWSSALGYADRRSWPEPSRSRFRR